jgi:DMSO reductase anchor subunit
MSHLPHVLFTVFTQISVGALIAMVIADFFAKNNKELNFVETGAWVSPIALVIGAIAMLSHEAKPILAAMSITNNFPTSPLSFESGIMTGFGILMAVCFLLWVLHKDYGTLKFIPGLRSLATWLTPLRKPVGILAAVVGLVFVPASAAAYMLPGLPGTSLITTPVFFYVTTLMAGMTAVAAVLSVKYLIKKENEAVLARLLWVTWGISLAMMIVLIFAIPANISLLKVPAETEMANIAQAETLEGIIAGECTSFFWARLIIGVVLPIICLAVLPFALKKKEIAKASGITVLLFVLVLIGEIAGRMVLLASSVPLGEVAPYVLSYMPI